MKRWLTLGACLLALPVWADEWRDTLSPPRPGTFPPPRPYHAVYRLGWSGVIAAEARFDLTKAARDEMQLTMKTRTIGLVRTLWRLDALHAALCQLSPLRPIRLEQTEIYKDETESTRAEFSAEEVVRQTRVTPLKGRQEKEKRLKLPNVYDLQTELLFIRSQRLQPGEKYRLLVYPSTSAYLTEIEVLKRERLKVAGSTRNAIKCEVRLQAVTKKLELAPQKNFKRAFAWLSDDRDRLLLKIEAEIFVGSVWVELQSVEFDPKS